MTEPTAEQVSREAECAHVAINGGPGMCRGTFPDGTPWHSPLCMSVSTALARVRIEAHAAGRDEGLREAETNERGAADSLAEWMSRKPIGSQERVTLSTRAGERYQSADAIRALRGRT